MAMGRVQGRRWVRPRAGGVLGCRVEGGVGEDPCGLAMWAGRVSGEEGGGMAGLRYTRKSVLSVTPREGLEGQLQCDQSFRMISFSQQRTGRVWSHSPVRGWAHTSAFQDSSEGQRGVRDASWREAPQQSWVRRQDESL